MPGGDLGARRDSGCLSSPVNSPPWVENRLLNQPQDLIGGQGEDAEHQMAHHLGMATCPLALAMISLPAGCELSPGTFVGWVRDELPVRSADQRYQDKLSSSRAAETRKPGVPEAPIAGWRDDSANTLQPTDSTSSSAQSELRR